MVIEGMKQGLRAKVEAFVPLADHCEANRLTLTNEERAEKSVELFSFVEFCLWNAQDDSSNFQRNFSYHNFFERKVNGIP